MPLISVIMPVYNSSKFLDKAIESVLNQSLRDIELILINDGSTDNCDEICNLYALKDNRVIVIHQKNGGICAARNVGLDLARGEYIAFADNDDEYMDDLLNDNYNLAISENADIVKFGIHYIDIDAEGESKEIYDYELTNGFYDKRNLKDSYKMLRQSNVFMFVWNSLFKKSMIKDNHIYFDTRIKFGGEDCVFNYDCLAHTKKLVVSKDKYYKHFRRTNHSTVLKYNFNKAESAIIMAEKELSWISSTNILDKYPNYWDDLVVRYLGSIIIVTLDKRYENTMANKTKFLNSIQELSQFRETLERKKWMDLILKTKKFGLFAFLLAKKKYKTLLFLVQVHGLVKRQ